MPSLQELIAKRIACFKKWWQSPASRRDRFVGALVGAFGGFWIGALVLLVFATPPIPLHTIGLSALGCAILGVALGVLYPKGTALLLFPFSIFGFGGGS